MPKYFSLQKPSIATAPSILSTFLLLYVLISISVSMTITQEEVPEPNSLRYWLIIAPAVLFPFTNLRSLLPSLLGSARFLWIFALLAGSWQYLRGDSPALMQLILLVWVLNWLSCRNLTINLKHLVFIYLLFVVVGFLVWVFTDLNKWGVFPGLTLYQDTKWRISFFPNIAISATFSLLVFLAVTHSHIAIVKNKLVLLICLYFSVFSYVRTVNIALLLYLFCRYVFSIKRLSPRSLFWLTIFICLSTNILIANSSMLVSYLGDIPLVSRFFLRGEVALSAEQVFEQLYRPWLWMQHLNIFINSPGLMGEGSFDLVDMVTYELLPGTTPVGNESQFTRLLATYGLPALLYIVFFLDSLRRACTRIDLWSISCFPPISLLFMQWGNIFHPTDAIGSLYVLILIRGSTLFSGDLMLRSRSEVS